MTCETNWMQRIMVC